jgi:hypothetical protein
MTRDAEQAGTSIPQTSREAALAREISEEIAGAGRTLPACCAFWTPAPEASASTSISAGFRPGHSRPYRAGIHEADRGTY